MPKSKFRITVQSILGVHIALCNFLALTINIQGFVKHALIGTRRGKGIDHLRTGKMKDISVQQNLPQILNALSFREMSFISFLHSNPQSSVELDPVPSMVELLQIHCSLCVEGFQCSESPLLWSKHEEFTTFFLPFGGVVVVKIEEKLQIQ